MHILITGAAGFIGYHLVRRLLLDGFMVTGIDNYSPYYDIHLKKDRIAQIEGMPEAGQFNFEQVDLADKPSLHELFKNNNFTHVVNLAAQAGVRASIENPEPYINSNLVGFANLLEECRLAKIEHLVFASSSSVYGLNEKLPYSTSDNVDHPASLYAATKKSNELLAHSYSHIWQLPATGLRFFTVYGPWGRPDMALYLFTDAILKNKPIRLFNRGKLQRDFTYIDDIVEGMTRVLFSPPKPNPDYDAAASNPAASSAPWRIFNIGNNHTIPLMEFVETLEQTLGKKAQKELLPMQPGDVKSTWADISQLERFCHFSPNTDLKSGLESYVKWHRSYYG